MYRSLFLATFAVFVGNSAGATTPQDPLSSSLIVGGQDADISDYPYTVPVRILDVQVCDGSIIADNVVLTAAHCVNNGSFTEKDYSIQYGVTRIGGTENLINVTKLIFNEKYNDNSSDYDVGLIILASAIPLGPKAQIIPLATKSPAVGTNAVVAGWGTRDQIEDQSDILQSVTVQIISNEECQKQYSVDNMTITDRMLCAGVPGGGKDACNGDSGGPLAANGQLVGIVSWGHGCAEANFFGVYSNVANLRDWILKNSR